MATTSVKYPGSSSGSWTNSSYAYSNDGSQYATAAPAKNSTVTGYWYNFNFAIPTGATINSVTMEAEYKVSTQDSNATFLMACCIGTTVRGTEYTDATEPLTDTVRSSSNCGTWTVSELNDNTSSGMQIRLGAQRGSSNNAVTFSVDYIKVTVDYTLNVSTTAVVATATAAAIVPTISVVANASTTAVAATATASALAPEIITSVPVEIVVPSAPTATAAALAPTFVEGSGTSVTAVLATATASALEPTFSLGAGVTTPVMTASADAPTPSVLAVQNISIDVPVSTADGAALAPTITTVYDGYYIEKKIGDGEWLYLTTLYGLEQNSYDDESVFEDSVTYYYRIKRVVGLLESEWAYDDVTFSSGSSDANVIAPAATAVAAAGTPTISGDSSVTATVSTAGAAALEPTITGSAVVTSILATASADMPTPTITAIINVSVTSVTATADAAALEPSITGDASIVAVIATASAEALVPSITAAQNISVEAVTATAGAAALAPDISISGDISVFATVATASAAAVVPSISGVCSITAVLATATAAAIPPEIFTATNISVEAVTASATASASPPVITVVAHVEIVSVAAAASASAPSPRFISVLTGVIRWVGPPINVSVLAVSAGAASAAFPPTISGVANITASTSAATAAAHVPDISRILQGTIRWGA